MTETVIIRGKYADRQFTPNEPLPAIEGPAELVVHATRRADGQVSIFELFGKAPTLRSKEDIEKQLRQDRDEWGEP